jgi:tRNA (guanine-N(7)-)-methyltransferase
MVSQAQIDAIEWPTDDDADTADVPPRLPVAAAGDALADSAAHARAFEGVPAPGWVASDLASLLPLDEVPPVDILDVGAGFGGLLLGLNQVFPKARKLGLEIRQRVAEFVRLKILAARARGDEAACRCAVLRVNAMRQLHSFLPLGGLSMIFICFPDPHFKRQNHRRRIVSPALLSEYAALLRPGGILWTITDVPALHAWMRDHLREHASFREREVDERDPCVQAMRTATDEARKSMREGRTHEYNAFVKVTDEEADAEAAKAPFFGGYYGGIAFSRTAKGTNDAPEMFNLTVKEREAEAKKAKMATKPMPEDTE